MYKNYVSKPDEEVKIIGGKFKGIFGYPQEIEMSASETTKIHIRVDDENVIKVDLHEVEFLYDDYLIYKKDYNKDSIIDVYGKQRLRKDMIDEYLKSKYAHELHSYLHPEYCICAIPMNKVEFKFEDKSLTIDEIKKIVS